MPRAPQDFSRHRGHLSTITLAAFLMVILARPMASADESRSATAASPPAVSSPGPVEAPEGEPRLDGSAGSSAPTSERWGWHFQMTSVTQADGDNNVPPYEQPGANGFSGDSQTRTSFTSTLFLGARVVPELEFYVNPEVSAGSGLSGTHGIAGFPNGEIYRVDSTDAKLNLARLYVRYVLGRGGETEEVASAPNQIASVYDENRASVVLGKFSLNDFFDGNAYAHDPRTQFLNWSLMDNGAWDYAADTRGYTWGLMLEWNQRNFAVRFASVLEPNSANQLSLDHHILRARGDNLEFEYRYDLNDHPGKARLLAYMNHANMGSYQVALEHVGFKTVDITDSRTSRTKYGVGLNLEQELDEAWGAFARIGWNDGQTESWAFTEVDLTASGGLVWKPFMAREDRWGVALIANALSPHHRRYLEAGGRGFMIGEGGMNYAPEEIFESYYLVAICPSFAVSADFQLVNNAAYNQDRSGVVIGALRLHAEL